MRYKKFILWFVLFFGYIGFLHLFSTPVETSASGTIKEGTSVGSILVPGISNVVTVQITRAPREYLFGIIKAPAYVLGMNIDSLNHLVIDYVMPLLLLIFIVWEVILYFRKEGRGSGLIDLEKLGMTRVVKKIEKEEKSVFANKNVLMVLTKSLGIGILLAFLTFLFGDSPAIAVLLLVIYMEIKFRKKEKYI